MTATNNFHSPQRASERLLDALLDKTRCDAAVLALLAGYAAVWTLYATISRSSQGLHPDMTELIAWSRDLSLGYLKHPPLAAWLVRVWFSVMPLTEWSYYLLSVLMPTAALWVAWRLSVDYLSSEKRIIGLALLTFIPFYNFLALRLNANTILLPTWAITTLWFLRSYRTRSIMHAALTGLGAGACMLAKYWSVFLIAGLLLAALVDSRRSIYFRSAAPWISAAIGIAVIGPHLAWLYQQDFAPFEYAMAKHVTFSVSDAMFHAGGYLAGLIAYAAMPIVVVLLLARPDRATLSTYYGQPTENAGW
jgi:4-amino-4-deoxy-L-arabinose transferase-like glycosyltransferase